MAKPNLTSGERLRIYRLLYRLNRSFHFLVCYLSEAQALGMVGKRDAVDLLGMTQETQVEINLAVFDHLHHCEDRDYVHFGKVRAALEKRLKG